MDIPVTTLPPILRRDVEQLRTYHPVLRRQQLLYNVLPSPALLVQRRTGKHISTHSPYKAKMQQSPGLNTSTDSSAELAAVVDDLLNQLNTKFTTISSDLLSKSESQTYHCGAVVNARADAHVKWTTCRAGWTTSSRRSRRETGKVRVLASRLWLHRESLVRRRAHRLLRGLLRCLNEDCDGRRCIVLAVHRNYFWAVLVFSM